MTGLIVTCVFTFALGIVVGIIVGRRGFHIHKWGPWVFFRDTNYYRSGRRQDGELPTRITKVYTRICEKCHLPETKEIDA